MSPSLFDPGKAAGAESTPPAGGGDARPLTVSQASDLIRTALERHTPGSLRVLGEVSNLSTRQHWYFSLKDDKCVLPCVAWATTVRGLSFTPRDGDEVVVTGHISHYGQQGKTQLYVSAIAAVGAGALELRFRALCEQLRALGYFEDARKRSLPTFPRRIAVITSSGGAAVHDVIHTAALRCKAVGLVVVDVRVQGAGAADEIARAIAWVNARREALCVDAILVTRGGGSIEDLWAFNERIVADAIFRSHLPVVAAIGHESDTTIAELVADARASTPTQAAVRLVPSARELARHTEHLQQRMRTLLSRALERRCETMARSAQTLHRAAATTLAACQVRLQRNLARLARARPESVLAQRGARLRLLIDGLHACMARRMEVRRQVQIAERALRMAMVRHVRAMHQRTTAAEARLAAVDPLGVLRRGYSITTLSDGEVVRSMVQVRAGQAIATRVVDGTFLSLVASSSAGRRSARAGDALEGDAAQFDLFRGSR